jgi:hypothetical protein
MWRVIRGIGLLGSSEIGGGRHSPEAARGVIEGRGDLFCNVEDGFDTTLHEALPVAGVFLRADPDARDDLDWAVCIGEVLGTTVLVLAVEQGREGGGGGREGDDGGTSGSLWSQGT